MKSSLVSAFVLGTVFVVGGCGSSSSGNSETVGGAGAANAGATNSLAGASGSLNQAGSTASNGAQSGSTQSSGAGGAGTSGSLTSAGSSGAGRPAAGGTSAVAAGAGGKAPVAGGPAAGGTAGSGTGSTPVEKHGSLKVVGTQLTDEHGAPVVLKGPSSMWLNWESEGFATDKQGLKWMRDNWNARVIRAAMGITTTDTKDKDYLTAPAEAKAQVETIIKNAIDLGLYVIIDWHDSTADQHQAQAVEFFTEMAATYGSYPNVIYETFNEPTRQAWGTVVKPYHEAVVAAIRDKDPDNVIILGTPNWSQFVDVAAGDPVQGTNLMYTLHFYSCTHDAKIRALGDTALSKGLPLFVTEWGATNADGGTPKNPQLCTEEAQAWHDWMAEHKISWAAWKFDNCVDLSCYFKTEVTQTTGEWTDDMLNGHGPFVRDRMKEE